MSGNSKSANYRSISTGLASTLMSRRQSPISKFNRTTKNAKCIKISQIVPLLKNRRQPSVRKLRFACSEYKYKIKKASHDSLLFESSSMANKPSIKVWVTPTSSKFKKDIGNCDQFDDRFTGANSDNKGNNILNIMRNLNDDLEKEINYKPCKKLGIPIKQMHPIEYVKRAMSPGKVLRGNPRLAVCSNKTYNKLRSVTNAKDERKKIPLSVNAFNNSIRRQQVLKGLIGSPNKMNHIDHQLSVTVPAKIAKSGDRDPNDHFRSGDHCISDSHFIPWQPKLNVSDSFDE